MAQLLEEMVNRSGLFRLVGDTIEFRHFLLQEFFAGRGISSIEFLQTVIGEEWWQRAIVFYFGDHPGDGKGLQSIEMLLSSRPVDEVYQAALTIGLALQASYLIELKDKVEIFRWVVDGLADGKDHLFNAMDPAGRFPVTRFIFYYLVGRDSVALSVLKDNLDEIERPWDERDLSQDERDIRRFWLIIGLVESGSLNEVEQMVRKFSPSDDRLLLGIHMGCFLIAHLHVSSKEQIQLAKRISERLTERVSHLRVRFLDEFNLQLSNLRDDVKAIGPAPEN